jgi:CHAD domain-containing protein
VRDADVQLERLQSEDADLLNDLKPYVDRLKQTQATGRDALLEALRGERYVTLLDRLVDAERDPLVSEAARRSAGRVLPDLAKRAWKRLEPQAKALQPEDPDERYHAVRIRAKRLRYAAEAIGPALGERAPALARVAAAAASLQDLLGEMHDAFVTRADLEGLAHAAKGREYAFALGRLVERRSAAMREGRQQYPKAWRRLAKRWRKA